MGFRSIGKVEAKNVWELWIKDYSEFREQAPERDQRIRRLAATEKAKVLVESSLDSTDAGQYVRNALRGLRTVIPVTCKGDKAVRCVPVEPIFDAGNVHVFRGPWRKPWLDKLRRFDGSGRTHDEPVDNITCGYQYCCNRPLYGNLKNTFL